MGIESYGNYRKSSLDSFIQYRLVALMDAIKDPDSNGSAMDWCSMPCYVRNKSHRARILS
jgi:hypothetical protein